MGRTCTAPATGDKIIKDLWDEIEAHFRICILLQTQTLKEYGVVYYYRKRA